MANDIYDDALEGLQPEQPAVKPKNDYLEMFQADDTAAQVPLRQSMVQASSTTPDRAADVQKLSEQTGLPGDVVDRNFDDLKKRQQFTDQPYTQIQEQSPIVAAWASKPANASVAADDLANLGALEWLLKAPSRAVAQTLNGQGYGALRTTSLFRDLTTEETDRMNAYRLHMQDGGALGADQSWFRGAVTGGIKLATMLASTVPVYGLGGAALGGLAGSIAGPEGTIAGAKIGFEAGNLYGLGKMAFQTEAGSAYDSYLELKDNLGQPIDPKVARMAALATGAVNAALMTGGGAVISKTIGVPLEKLSTAFMKDAIGKALTKPTVLAAMLDASKTYGLSLTEGTALMVGMKAFNILGGEIAKTAAERQGSGAFDRPSPSDVGQSLLQAAREGAQSFALAAAFSPAVGFAHDAARAYRAQDAPTFFNALAEGVAQSKTAQRLPEAARDFIDQATKGGPLETVYAPLETWNTYWQDKGVDPADVAARVTGSRDVYDQATASGSDLAIPTSRYATTLAATEHNAFFANELRLGPDEMNGREAAAFAETVKNAQAPEPKADSSTRAAVLEQLDAAGVPKDTAEHYANLYDAVIGNVAERAGVNPADLFGGYGLKVQREGMPGFESPEGVDNKARPAQTSGGHFNVDEGLTTEPPGIASATEGGDGLSDRGVQQPHADQGRLAEGEGNGDGAQPRQLPAHRLADVGYGSDEPAFRRRPLEENAARLTPEVRRELKHMLEELGNGGYEGRNWDFVGDQPGVKTGNAGAGDWNVTAGHGEIDLYKDIRAFSPLNKNSRTGELAKGGTFGAEGSGAKVSAAVADILKTGDVKSNLAEGALRVAENRAADQWAELSPLTLPRSWAEGVNREFTAAVSDAIDAQLQATADLLNGDSLREEDTILDPDGPVDTSFNIKEFEQSLFDDIDPIDPTNDELTAKSTPEVLPAGYVPKGGIEQIIQPHQRPKSEGKLVAEASKLIDEMYPPGSPEREEYDALQAESSGERNEFGEEQPALLEGVREQDIKTPEFDAPFSLTSEIAKPRAGKNRTLFQTVYHGTPHVFDAFSLHAIGSGEGNQSYGWGLYFTSTKEIAERYKNLTQPEEIKALENNLGFLRADRERMSGEHQARYDEMIRGAEQRIERLKAANGKGHVVTADIPEDDNMLDYDKPASQQPPKVQDALRRLGVTWNPIEIPNTKDALRLFNSEQVQAAAKRSPGIREELTEGLYYATTGNKAAFDQWYVDHHVLLVKEGINDPTGSQIYENLKIAAMKDVDGEVWNWKSDTLAGSAEAASKRLNDVGVHGIKYLDGFSRADGDGTHNYVVFDDKLAKITEFSQGPVELTKENVDAWAAEVKQRVGSDLSDFDVYLAADGSLRLLGLAVARGAQRAGLGSSVMQELTRFADLNGRVVTLTPAKRGFLGSTTSKSRLIKFYERFGFVQDGPDLVREPTLGGAIPEPTVKTDLAGNVLEQEKRGAIRFGGDRQFTIALMERADTSTFLHESGHFFLEVMGDLADKIRTQDASTLTDQQRGLVADYDSLLEHFGVKTRDEIGTPQHEDFARTFEAYLMKGEAPSVALQGSFARFRAWLVGVYRSLTNLKVNLTPEVTAVLDRLVASDRAIQDAEGQRGIVAMFTAPEDVGMSPTEFGLYRKTVEQASRTAREQLDAKLFADVAREQTAAWKEQRADIRGKVEADIQQQPEYQALAAMQRGTHPNGEPLIEGVTTDPLKLSRAILNDRYGPERAKRLPRGIVAREGGVDPEVVARMFGFNSGDAMLTAVERAPEMKAVIEQRTKERMFEENGNVLLDGTLHAKAQAAVVNEDHDLVIRAELRALGKMQRTVRPFLASERKMAGDERAYERRWLEAEAKLRIAIAEGHKQVEIDALQSEVNSLKAQARGGAATIRAGIPPAGLLKQAADARIASLPIGSIQPEAFWSASRRAAAMAIDRAARQDFEGAIQAKQQELVNVNLYRRAEKALEDIEVGRRFALSLTTDVARKRIGLAGGSYLDQIDGILDRFEFAKVADKVLERRGSLRAWAESLTAEGMPGDQLPEDLLNEANRKNYREMTLDEFTGVTDGLRQIAHLAALKNRLLKAADAREFGEVRDGVVASIFEHNTRKPTKLEFTKSDEAWRGVDAWFASHRKISNIVQALDGFEDGGPMWSAFMRPINEAADLEVERKQKAGADYAKVIDDHYTPDDMRRMGEKRDIPGVGALTKEATIALALNWGNETSRERVLADPQRVWSREQVHAILDTLDKRDWDFVQATWNHIDTYWEEIAAKQERVTGIAPEKVDPMPVETKFGQYDGGYYPLQYDSRFPTGVRVAQNELASKAKLESTAAYVRTTTARGHVETRKSNVKLPLRLDLSVVHNHLEQVIHDLSQHEMLIDTTRLLRDPKVSKAIIETMGDAGYQQLTSAIQDIALGGGSGPRNAMDKAASFIRGGTQIAQLGWNFWTALQAPLGLFNGMARVGPSWVARGAGRWMRDAATLTNTLDWINTVSPMMRERGDTANPDLADLRTAFREPGGWFDTLVRKTTGDHLTVQTITDSMLWHLSVAYRVAEVPTWLGQYEKSMAAGETEDRAFRIADQAVLDTHGGSALKDLSQVQRGGAVAKLFMMFYNYGNTVYNATAREFGQVEPKSAASVGRFVGNLGLLYIAPAIIQHGLATAFGRETDKTPGDWFKGVAGESVNIALNTMVLVREAAGAVENALSLQRGGDRGYGGPAGTRLFDLLDQLGKEIHQGKLDTGLEHAALAVGGVLAHFPSTQIQRTIDGWVALEEGRTKNPMALVVGPPPKNQPK